MQPYSKIPLHLLFVAADERDERATVVKLYLCFHFQQQGLQCRA